MTFIWFVVMSIVAYTVGVFGFTQIFGSIQHARVRGIGFALFTILLWAAILIGVALLAHKHFQEQLVAYYLGTATSFLMSLKAAKFGIE